MTSNTGFTKGDRVHIYDISNKAWETDAVVIDVLGAPLQNDGSLAIPAGSVVVSVSGGARTNMILPQYIDTMLRKAEDQGIPSSGKSTNSDPDAIEEDEHKGTAMAAADNDADESKPNVNVNAPDDDKVVAVSPPVGKLDGSDADTKASSWRKKKDHALDDDHGITGADDQPSLPRAASDDLLDCDAPVDDSVGINAPPQSPNAALMTPATAISPSSSPASTTAASLQPPQYPCVGSIGNSSPSANSPSAWKFHGIQKFMSSMSMSPANVGNDEEKQQQGFNWLQNSWQQGVQQSFSGLQQGLQWFKRDGSDALSRTPSASSLGSECSQPDLQDICKRIDKDGDGFISQFELLSAMQRDDSIAKVVLPGVDSSVVMSDESCFDAIDSLFKDLSNGKAQIKYEDFISHFGQGSKLSRKSSSSETRIIYTLIDSDASGHVSKLEFLTAVQSNSKVAEFVLSRHGDGRKMSDEEVFRMATRIFDTIAAGKKRFDYREFKQYFQMSTNAEPRQHTGIDRASIRVFIIGPGFGGKLNPRQGAMITDAGFQVHWCHDVPNPEQPNFPVQPYLEHILKQIKDFEPHVVAGASKGGAYITGLWQTGLWRGPTVLINAHPTCTRLPEGVPVVVTQGSNDEVYPSSRAHLEALIASGSPNQCYLHYTANSGVMPTGQMSRIGDRHNQDALLRHDLLPRLVDAVLCSEGPEVSMVRSWRDRLSKERLEAERWLGYSAERLQRRWSFVHDCKPQKVLFDVAQGSEEFQRIAAIFHAAPKEPAAYQCSPQAAWEQVKILNVQRIENNLQVDGSSKPYCDSVRRSLVEQGISFEPGVHTCWAFHGANSTAIESIIANPVAGFQPLAAGSRGASLWGLGTYFARDAKYVADGGFCGPPASDGTRQILLCLLSTGIPCLGDPLHKGVLPFRRRPHCYNCSVDCLSSPEIYVMQHAGAAQPAYLITFA